MNVYRPRQPSLKEAFGGRLNRLDALTESRDIAAVIFERTVRQEQHTQRRVSPKRGPLELGAYLLFARVGGDEKQRLRSMAESAPR